MASYKQPFLVTDNGVVRVTDLILKVSMGESRNVCWIRIEVVPLITIAYYLLTKKYRRRS